MNFHKTTATGQPSPVLDYQPRRSRGLSHWLRRLPWPSWVTVCSLLFAAAAAYWLYTDHATWVVIRQFDGAIAHNSPDAAISPDGTQLVLILPDKQTLRLYDIATGRIIRDFRRPSGEVTTAHFSPEGTRIWSIGTDQNAILWEMSTGKMLASLHVDDRFPPMFGSSTASPFSADDKWVVAWDEHETRICDGHSGAILAELAPEDHIEFPIFSPDCRCLVGVGNPSQEVRIIDTKTWQRISAFTVGGRGQGVNGWNLAFTPDSRSLVIACVPSVYVWDAAANRVSTAFAVAGQLAGCCLSPNGRNLLTRNDNGPEEIWDMASRTRLGAVSDKIGGFAMISPDGTRIAGPGAMASFPSLEPLAEISSGDDRVAWLPGSRALITGSWNAFDSPRDYPVHLLERRRPEAAYGLLWLPQFWLLVLAGMVSLGLIARDLRRWRAAPPFAQA